MITSLKIAMDRNGNKVLRIKNDGRSFSIQTNGNLPITHRWGVVPNTFKEVCDYLSKYGTMKQKEIFYS
jgi:hypothetical protein